MFHSHFDYQYELADCAPTQNVPFYPNNGFDAQLNWLVFWMAYKIWFD